MNNKLDHGFHVPLPPIPDGFGLPFFYAALFNIEVAFLVDHQKVEPYLKKQAGLIAANFSNKAIVSFNYQLYTGQFPNGASNTQEIELNIVAYPESQKNHVAQVTAEQYLSGDEQTKFMGHKRVWVPCDSDNAIKAGKELFGEPKFKTSFTTSIPSLNAQGETSWSVTCNDPADSSQNIFNCVANINGIKPISSAYSPITEYGSFDGKLIGCRWNILQPTNLYFLSEVEGAALVQMTYGSSDHPMKSDLQNLIGHTPAFAVRTSMSAPAAIQSRAYYV